jgi:hypothetical protein
VTRRRTRKPRRKTATPSFGVREIDSLRGELERIGEKPTPRWNADPKDVQASVVKLVLTLVEFLRQLMERQAIRRMEDGTLTPKQIESVGTALMRLEETIHELCRRFEIEPEDLNLELGPLGRML